MIIRFKDKDTEVLFKTGSNRRYPNNAIERAKNRLDRLHLTKELKDLRIPPGLRFEKLKGHHPPRYSIRVNDQYRITFEWTDQGPSEVMFEDYH